MEHHVCHISKIPDSDALIVDIDERSIGIFNSNGRLYAVKNLCPHKQAPIARGTLEGTMLPTDCPGDFKFGLEGCVLKCPWHGWEFDIETGQCLFGVSNTKVKTYSVKVIDEQVYLEL